MTTPSNHRYSCLRMIETPLRLWTSCVFDAGVTMVSPWYRLPDILLWKYTSGPSTPNKDWQMGIQMLTSPFSSFDRCHQIKIMILASSHKKKPQPYRMVKFQADIPLKWICACLSLLSTHSVRLMNNSWPYTPTAHTATQRRVCERHISLC